MIIVFNTAAFLNANSCKLIICLLVVFHFGCARSLQKTYTLPLCTQVTNVSLCGSSDMLEMSAKSLGVTFDLDVAEEAELQLVSKKFDMSYQEMQQQRETGELKLHWRRLVDRAVKHRIFDVFRQEKVLAEAAWMVPQIVNQVYHKERLVINVDRPIDSSNNSIDVAKEICSNDNVPPGYELLRKQACKVVFEAKKNESTLPPDVDKTTKKARAIWAISLYVDRLRSRIERQGSDLYLLKKTDVAPHVDKFGNLYVSRAFIDSLTKQELRLLFLHEAGHLTLLFSDYSLAGLMKSGVNSQAFGKSTKAEIISYTSFLRQPNEPMVDLYALAQISSPEVRSNYRNFVLRLEKSNVERAKLIRLGELYLNAGYPLGRLLAASEFSIHFSRSLLIENLNRIVGENQACLLSNYALIHANWQVNRIIGWIIEDGRSKQSPWALRDRIEWLPRTSKVSTGC